MNFFVPSRVATAGNNAADFDSWFENELKSYWEETFGKGVLVLKLPEQLFVLIPQPPAPTPRFRLSERKLTTGAGVPPFFSIKSLTGTSTSGRNAVSVSTLKASAATDHPYFSIQRTVVKEPVPLDKVPQERRSPRPANYADLQAALKTRKASKYYDGVDVTDDLRRHLGIGLSPFSDWKCGSLSETEGNPAPGIQTPYLYVAATEGPSNSTGAVPVAPFALHVEDGLLYSLNYLHKGAEKYWVVVHPHDSDRLERRLLAESSGGSGGGGGDDAGSADRCSQFLRHKSVWVPLDVLDLWDIRYTTVVQKKGDLVVTAPGAYHQGWNGGWNVAEAINYGDGASAKRIRGYRHCRLDCPYEGEKPLRIEWRDKPAAPRRPEIHGWSVPRPTQALKLGPNGKPLDVESTLACQRKLTVHEVRLLAPVLQQMLQNLCDSTPPNYSVYKPLKEAAELCAKVTAQPNKRAHPEGTNQAASSIGKGMIGRAAARKKRALATGGKNGTSAPSRGRPTVNGLAENRAHRTRTSPRLTRPAGNDRPPTTTASGPGIGEGRPTDGTASGNVGERANASARGEVTVDAEARAMDVSSRNGGVAGITPSIAVAPTAQGPVLSSVNRADNNSPAVSLGRRDQRSISISAIVSHDDGSDPSGSTTTSAEVQQLATQQNGVRQEAGAEATAADNSTTVESGVAPVNEVAGTDRPTDAPLPGAQTTSHDNSGAADSGVAGHARPAEISIPTTADPTVASAAASAADANSAEETTLVNEASASEDHNDANAAVDDDDDDDVKKRRRRQEPAIDTDPDRALTHLCARVMADLDGWNSDRASLDEQIRAALQPRSSSGGGGGGNGGGGDTAAFFQTSVRDRDGNLWDAPAMLRHMNATQAHVARARFHHALALMQLAAWVALRVQQPDLQYLATEKERLTRVLDVLEAEDPERNRRAWWRCLTAGQRWTALATEFGIGVAVILPSMMGFSSKGLAYESKKDFENVLSARADDRAFRHVTNHVTTMLQTLYVPTMNGSKETAEAKKYLEAGAHGHMPWRDGVTPSTTNAQT